VDQFAAFITPRLLHQCPKQLRLLGNMGVTPRSVQVIRVAALVLAWYRNACAALETEPCITRFLEMVKGPVAFTYGCYYIPVLATNLPICDMYDMYYELYSRMNLQIYRSDLRPLGI